MSVKEKKEKEKKMPVPAQQKGKDIFYKWSHSVHPPNLARRERKRE